MAKFLVVFDQEEGCDYTIGCGTMVLSVDAPTKEEAFRKAMDDVGWLDYLENAQNYGLEDHWSGESHMDSVTIYEIVDHGDADMFEEFQRAVYVRQEHIRKERTESNDLKELERLARKLGKTVT